MKVLIIDQNKSIISGMNKSQIKGVFKFASEMVAVHSTEDANEYIQKERPKFIVMNKQLEFKDVMAHWLSQANYDEIIMSDIQELFISIGQAEAYSCYLKRPFDLYFKNNSLQFLNNLNEPVKENKSLSVISVSSLQQIIYLNVNEIVYCKANRQYTDIHMTDKTVHLSSHTLLYYDNMLCNSGFVRVHRSYLVNLSHVKLFHRSSEEIKLSNGHGIKLAYNMREEFLDLMSNYIKKSP